VQFFPFDKATLTDLTNFPWGSFLDILLPYDRIPNINPNCNFPNVFDD